MLNVYKITLKKIIYLCKFIGIIKLSYILEPDGLLIQSTDTVYKCLELTRMILLIIFTYFIHMNTYFTQKMYLFKFWSVIIASRISETRLIQLMNGIIEFDQKLTSLTRFVLIRHLLPEKSYWNIIFIFTLIYYSVITLLLVYLWPPGVIHTNYHVQQCFFRIEFIQDVIVIFSTTFFLQQLEYRFQALNDSWEYLLPGFPAVLDDLTRSITEMTLDNIRLLHAELSELLRTFSMGYGQMLLGFFVFNYINILVSFYFNILHPINYIIDSEFNFNNFLIKSLPFIFGLQNIIFILSIIISASRVHDKKRKMISYLRLIRISNLSPKLKNQVKMFMNQISVFESSEITAFGVFNINLNLVISILLLLITGFVTIIQMKEHPIILQIKQDLNKFLEDVMKVQD